LEPTSLEEIDTLLRREDAQSVADSLVDLVAQVANDGAKFDELVEHYGASEHASLQRVLTFFVSRRAPSSKGPNRNLIYSLVPATIGSRDASALTNAITTVKLLAMHGPPWYPPEQSPPHELVELLVAGLRRASRTVEPAFDLLDRLAVDELFLGLDRPSRRLLVDALDPVRELLDPDRFTIVIDALSDSPGSRTLVPSIGSHAADALVPESGAAEQAHRTDKA